MVNVYDEGQIIARVNYNSNLDYWDGRNWSCGSVGHHLGITKLQKIDKYVLIHGTDWESERDYAEIVTDEEALQAILSSNNITLLDEKKYSRLKALLENELDIEVV